MLTTTYEKNDPEAVKRLHEILDEFNVGMMVTIGRGELLHARPMAIARRDKDTGQLWFLTSLESEKMAETQEDSRCTVTFQGPGLFLSVAGHVLAVSRKDELHSLWSEGVRPWFPDGPDSPHLEALCLVPESAEYWDSRDRRLVKQVFRALVAVKDGERVKADEPMEHSVVQL